MAIQIKLHPNWNPHGVLVWWKTPKISWQPFTIKQIDLQSNTQTQMHTWIRKQHLGGETVIPAESISQIPDSSSIEPPGPPHLGGSCHLQSNRPCVPFLQGCGCWLSCLLWDLPFIFFFHNGHADRLRKLLSYIHEGSNLHSSGPSPGINLFNIEWDQMNQPNQATNLPTKTIK